jgi:hypothetical protein
MKPRTIEIKVESPGPDVRMAALLIALGALAEALPDEARTKAVHRITASLDRLNGLLKSDSAVAQLRELREAMAGAGLTEPVET